MELLTFNPPPGTTIGQLRDAIDQMCRGNAPLKTARVNDVPVIDTSTPELQPLVGETSEILHHGQPDYATLKCPKCGNTEDFVEYAFRPTYQRFHKGGIDTEPDWQAFDYGDDVFPETIVCEAVNEATGDPCTQAVWNWKDGNVTKEMMETTIKEEVKEVPTA
jgi:hypothetical protein